MRTTLKKPDKMVYLRYLLSGNLSIDYTCISVLYLMLLLSLLEIETALFATGA